MAESARALSNRGRFSFQGRSRLQAFCWRMAKTKQGLWPDRVCEKYRRNLLLQVGIRTTVGWGVNIFLCGVQIIHVKSNTLVI
jgi:hypothetical protein